MMIHFIWNDENVPQAYEKFIASWRFHHPEATIRIWTFAEGEQIIADYYPDLYELFMQYDLPIQKANVLRYVLLHMFGGIYADLDMFCLKPLTALYESNEAFIGKHDNHFLCNAIMGSIPGHLYWQKVFDGLPAALEWMNMNSISVPQRAIHTTGSPYLQSIIEDFKQSVTIFDKEYFYPVGCMEAPEFYCGEHPNAYTIHYWNYSWGRKYDGVRDTITKFA